MENLEPKNFCGMAAEFNEAVMPLIDKFDILVVLAESYEDLEPINEIATSLLDELDVIFNDCAVTFLEPEDIFEAIDTWRKLNPNAKLNLIKYIHSRLYL